jgi:hypothetical protein
MLGQEKLYGSMIEKVTIWLAAEARGFLMAG